MRVLLRLLAPIVGLSVTPWMLIGMGFTGSVLLAHPWFAAFVALTMAFSVFVLVHFAKGETFSGNAIAEVIAHGAQNNYEAPLAFAAANSEASFEIERMRRTLRQQLVEAREELVSVRENDKRRV